MGRTWGHCTLASQRGLLEDVRPPSLHLTFHFLDPKPPSLPCSSLLAACAVRPICGARDSYSRRCPRCAAGAALRRFAGAPSLSRFVGAERAPGAAVKSETQVIDAVRQMVEPGLHGMGTCAIGTDPATSVTDARCRVHGIAGLRVVDCSIFPTPVSGNTNGPAMAVAARAAELILEDAAR